MRSMRSTFIVTLAGLLVLALATSVEAQRRKGKAKAPVDPLLKAASEDALTADDIVALQGKKANLLLADGKRVEDATLVKLITARDKARIKTISVEVVDKDGTTRTRGYPGKKLFRIEVEGRQYQLREIESQQAFALIDVEKHDKAVQAQLEAAGGKMWPSTSPEKQQEYVEQYKKDLQRVREHFPQLPLQLHESKYFLFMTDMPLHEVAPYLRQLDAMNEKLGEAFGFAPGENVWRGKAVIVAFVQEEAFIEYETEFMGAPPEDKVHGRAHQRADGTVTIGLQRGPDPAAFAAVLVHETAHGYMFRYKSDRVIPRWLNEGIADWIAGEIVKASNVVRQRQEQAAERLHGTHSLEGLFESPKPEAWQYGVASLMVDLMIRRDREAFRLFFDGIKEGLTWEVSLERAYAATPEDLIGLYGNAIGVPDLMP